jgi:ABC-type nitrate/sulfonate/bicarbonate transport system permease component
MRVLAAALSWSRGTLPLLAGLALWQALGHLSPQFPPPSAWLVSLTGLARAGLLVPAAAETLRILVISLALSTVVGFALGLALGTWPRLRQWSELLLEYGRAIPQPVLIPVFVLLLGYSDVMKVIVIAFACLWPVLLNTIAGVAAIRPLTFDVARSLRLTRLDTLRKIVVPATVPSLLLGLRVALPHAIIITLVMEMFTGAVGLGGLMMVAQRKFNAADVFGLLVLVGCLGLLLTALFSAVEKVALARWAPRA